MGDSGQITALINSLPPEGLQELRLAAHAALARRSLLPFATLVDADYRTPPHIRLVAQHLEAFYRREIEHLLVTLPPRHGKSELCTIKFPAWVLGISPSSRFIMAAHTATIAESFSILVRDLIDSNPNYHLAFPRTTISPTVRSASRWAVHGSRDSFIAAGIGGGITGYGADYLVIDDPVKNLAEATSQLVQERNWLWYTTVARTRLFARGGVLLVMTRWVEGDLAGRILDSPEGARFTVLDLPAESLGTEQDATPEFLSTLSPYDRKYAFPDRLGRPRGAPLWPQAGYDTEFLRSARQVLQHHFQGLYQGSPTQPSGEAFDKKDFRPVLSTQLQEWGFRLVARARSWDLAFSESERADPTVGLKAALYAPSESRPLPPDAPRFMILIEDIARWREEWDRGSERLIQTMQADGEDTILLVEAVASQNIAFKSLRRDPRLARYTVLSEVPIRDKVARAQYALRLSSLGVIGLLYPSGSVPPAWEEDFLNEIAAFPHASHDDQVDALTQLLNRWQPTIDNLLARRYNPPESSVHKLRRPRRPFALDDGSPFQQETVDRLGWNVEAF